MTVEADGPKRRTAAKTNVSETDIRALIEGSFMLNEPVRNVRPARYIHSMPVGWSSRSTADDAIT
jgi:hypothetical protein